jgi:hypothetical protein
MTKLMTISTLAAVLSVAIATNANAFPLRGLAFAHGGAAAFHRGGVWRGAGWRRGLAFAHGGPVAFRRGGVWRGAGWRRGGVAVGAAGGLAVGTTAGAVVASQYGPYAAPASVYVSPPGVYAGDAVIGEAYGYGRRAFVGGAGRFVGARAGRFAGARAGRFRR